MAVDCRLREDIFLYRDISFLMYFSLIFFDWFLQYFLYFSFKSSMIDLVSIVRYKGWSWKMVLILLTNYRVSRFTIFKFMNSIRKSFIFLSLIFFSELVTETRSFSKYLLISPNNSDFLFKLKDLYSYWFKDQLKFKVYFNLCIYSNSF